MAQKQYNTNHKLDIGQLRDYFARDNQENFIDVLLLQAEKDFSDYSEAEAQKEVELLLADLNQLWVKKQKDFLVSELKRAQESKDPDRENEILKQIMSF